MYSIISPMHKLFDLPANYLQMSNTPTCGQQLKRKSKRLYDRCCFLKKMHEMCWKALKGCLIPQHYHAYYLHCSEHFRIFPQEDIKIPLSGKWVVPPVINNHFQGALPSYVLPSEGWVTGVMWSLKLYKTAQASKQTSNQWWPQDPLDGSLVSWTGADT